jgi:hypothetical protein
MAHPAKWSQKSSELMWSVLAFVLLTAITAAILSEVMR